MRPSPDNTKASKKSNTKKCHLHLIVAFPAHSASEPGLPEEVEVATVTGTVRAGCRGHDHTAPLEIAVASQGDRRAATISAGLRLPIG